MESLSGSLSAAAGWSLLTCDVPLLLVSAEGEILEFSLGAERLLAGDEETLKGKPLHHIYAGEHPYDLLDRLHTLKENGVRRLSAQFRSGRGEVSSFQVIARRLVWNESTLFLLTLVDQTAVAQMKKEVARLKKELDLAYQRLDKMASQPPPGGADTQIEMAVLHQAIRALLTTIDLDRILYIVLTSVTAHPALGFSRAFLLLVDEKNGKLAGKMGVGPRNAEEAFRIWHELSQTNWGLEEFLNQHDTVYKDGELPLDSVIRRYQQPLTPGADVLVDALLSGEAVQVMNAVNDPRVSPECLEILACNQFAVAPLVTQEKAVGVLVADNLYKDQTITAWHLRLLNLLAGHAAMALQNAAMYTSLQESMAKLQKVQTQLIQAERLSAIGQMTAKVAHEIRNPLVTIGGFARSILKGLAPKSTQARKCSIIVDETMRLEEILQCLLDFTRQRELNLEYCRIETLLERVCSLLWDELQTHRIQVRRQIQKDLPELLLDVNKIEQILINLVKNALEAMKSGGTMTLSADLQGEFVSVKVADTGEGVPPDILGNIFNPFFTTKSEGFGLGLAICRTYIYDHGGNISVRSQAGAGTEFDVLLPLPSVPAGESDPATLI